MRRRGTAPHLGALHSRRSELRAVQGKDAPYQIAQADRQDKRELPDGTTEQAATVPRRRSSSLVAKTFAAVRFRSGAPEQHMLNKTEECSLVDAWLKTWATQGLEANREMRKAVVEELEGRCTVQDGVIVLEGDLNLRKKCAREKLIELPGKLRVSGNFVFRNFIELTELKGELTVDGDLKVSSCDTLTSLPEALHVCGTVDISKCWTLRLLPKNLTVGGDLELYDNCALDSLPSGLCVGGDMLVMKCNELTQCQGSIKVGGNLTLNECEALRALPNEMSVGGDLNLMSCGSLRTLPRSLTVGQSLNLNGCTDLAKIPNDTKIGGDLNLEGCTALETIPSALLNWPSRADGSVARVNITRTGLSDDAIESLLEMSLPNVQFLYNRDVVDLDTFKADSDFTSLKRAISFWARAAAAICPQEGAGTGYAKDIVATLEQDLCVTYQDLLIKFLSKLKGAKECGIDESRAALAHRILSTLDLLRESIDTKEEILQRIADSLDTCHDKPTWALNQLVLVRLVSKARGDREALRVVGRRVMNLMLVHEHAAMKIASLGSVDDVCVYLRYEIELREALNLPVEAGSMLFPNYIRISKEELDQVKDAVLAVTDAEFHNWLETWPEWERQNRLELAQEMQWDSLPSTLVSGSGERQTNLLGERAHDPIKLRGQVWSLSDVLHFWVPTGLDILRAPLSFDEIQQEMKRIVYSHAEDGGGTSCASAPGRPSLPGVKLAERRPAGKGWFKKTFGCMVPLKR